jgi:hypothetical protein
MAMMFWNEAARQRVPHTSAEGPMYKCALAKNRLAQMLRAARRATLEIGDRDAAKKRGHPNAAL